MLVGDNTYLRASGDREIHFSCFSSLGRITVLNSGILIFSSTNTPASQYIEMKKKSYGFDLNGLKGPNKIGRDIFFLTIDGEHGNILPFMTNDNEPPYTERTRSELINGVGTYNYQCSKTGRGMWCAALIIKDGWQIKDDYPW